MAGECDQYESGPDPHDLGSGVLDGFGVGTSGLRDLVREVMRT
jgi:hypothetical protein